MKNYRTAQFQCEVLAWEENKIRESLMKIGAAMGLDTSLNGRTALVGGASQGIGEATVRLLAEMGASVVLLSRSEEKLKTIAKSLPNPKSHQVLAVDLQDRNLLQQKLAEVLKKTSIEILVCNAGGPKSGPILSVADSTFLEAFETHILANQLLVNLCLPGMKKSNYGRIINIISTSIRQPIPNLGASNTIRSAVAAWSKTLSSEIGNLGITVNNILPGYTKTPRVESLLSAEMQRSGLPLVAVEEAWRKTVPLGRFADPREIANAIGFLSSPAASYITGVSLAVDGGRLSTL